MTATETPTPRLPDHELLGQAAGEYVAFLLRLLKRIEKLESEHEEFKRHGHG